MNTVNSLCTLAACLGYRGRIIFLSLNQNVFWNCWENEVTSCLRISDIKLCLMNKVITAPTHFPGGKDTSQLATLELNSKIIFQIPKSRWFSNVAGWQAGSLCKRGSPWLHLWTRPTLTLSNASLRCKHFYKHTRWILRTILGDLNIEPGHLVQCQPPLQIFLQTYRVCQKSCQQADMIFVKSFTQPDFQATSFIPQKCVICYIFLAN